MFRLASAHKRIAERRGSTGSAGSVEIQLNALTVELNAIQPVLKETERHAIKDGDNDGPLLSNTGTPRSLQESSEITGDLLQKIENCEEMLHEWLLTQHQRPSANQRTAVLVVNFPDRSNCSAGAKPEAHFFYDGKLGLNVTNACYDDGKDSDAIRKAKDFFEQGGRLYMSTAEIELAEALRNNASWVEEMVQRIETTSINLAHREAQVADKEVAINGRYKELRAAMMRAEEVEFDLRQRAVDLKMRECILFEREEGSKIYDLDDKNVISHIDNLNAAERASMMRLLTELESKLEDVEEDVQFRSQALQDVTLQLSEERCARKKLQRQSDTLTLELQSKQKFLTESQTYKNSKMKAKSDKEVSSEIEKDLNLKYISLRVLRHWKERLLTRAWCSWVELKIEEKQQSNISAPVVRSQFARAPGAITTPTSTAAPKAAEADGLRKQTCIEAAAAVEAAAPVQTIEIALRLHLEIKQVGVEGSTQRGAFKLRLVQDLATATGEKTSNIQVKSISLDADAELRREAHADTHVHQPSVVIIAALPAADPVSNLRNGNITKNVIAASTQHIRVADPPTHAKPATTPAKPATTSPTQNIRVDTRHSPAPAKPTTASPQKPAHSDARPETPAHTPASIPLVVKSEKKVLQHPPKEPETTTAPLPTPPKPKSNALDSAGGLWAEAKALRGSPTPAMSATTSAKPATTRPTGNTSVVDPPAHVKPATTPAKPATTSPTQNIRVVDSPAPSKPARASPTSPQKPAHSDARPETPAHTPASIPLVVKSEKKVLQPPPKEPETTTAPLPTPPKPKSNALDSTGGLWAEAKGTKEEIQNLQTVDFDHFDPQRQTRQKSRKRART